MLDDLSVVAATNNRLNSDGDCLKGETSLAFRSINIRVELLPHEVVIRVPGVLHNAFVKALIYASASLAHQEGGAEA